MNSYPLFLHQHAALHGGVFYTQPSVEFTKNGAKDATTNEQRCQSACNTCLDWGGNLRLVKDTPKAEEDVETPHTGFSEVVTAKRLDDGNKTILSP